MDCIFENAKVTINGGKVLDTNRLLTILNKETLNEPQTIQIITSVVAQCVNDLNTGILKIRNPTMYNCSTIPSAIMMCIHRKFFFNCPSNRFQNNQQCIQLKDFMQRCAVTI